MKFLDYNLVQIIIGAPLACIVLLLTLLTTGWIGLALLLGALYWVGDYD